MNTRAFEACHNFLSIWNQLKLQMVKAAEAYDISVQQVFALYMLFDTGGIPMGAVATRLHCDASNVTNIVDHLEARGYVQRQSSSDDRRKKCLVLTNQGTAVIEKIMHDLPAQLGFTNLSEAETKTLSSITQKLNIA